MSVNPGAVEERADPGRSARPALWRLAGPWWLFLLTGIVWVGFFALFRGISEIVIAFEVRSRQHHG